MLSTAINPEWAEAIKELIARYGLEEDAENVIIAFSDQSGRIKRCHILKRPFIRIVYPDRHYADFPLEDIIEATVRFPETLLSESLQLIYNERDMRQRDMDDTEGKEPREQ